MDTNHPKKIYWQAILPVLALHLILHFYANAIYGFHRDELLPTFFALSWFKIFSIKMRYLFLAPY